MRTRNVGRNPRLGFWLGALALVTVILPFSYFVYTGSTQADNKITPRHDGAAVKDLPPNLKAFVVGSAGDVMQNVKARIDVGPLPNPVKSEVKDTVPKDEKKAADEVNYSVHSPDALMDDDETDPPEKKDKGVEVVNVVPPVPQTPRPAGLAAYGVVDPTDPNCYVPIPYRGQSAANNNRCAPHWFVLGCLKTGTTSMYSYLALHPDVRTLAAASHGGKKSVHIKEPSFFNAKTDKSIESYWANFPVIHPGDHVVTGEASPGYIFWHAAPANLLQWLPEARVLALFREPIDRGFSRINHLAQLRLGERSKQVPISAMFDKIVEDQLPGVKRCMTKHFPIKNTPEWASLIECFADEASDSIRKFKAPPENVIPPIHLSLLKSFYNVRVIEHGLYYFQMKNWHWQLEAHGRPKEDIMILHSEYFFENTASEMNRVAAHLKLRPIDWSTITAKKYNVGVPAKGEELVFGKAGDGFVGQAPVQTEHPINPATRKVLEEFYAPYNKLLCDEMGWPLWDYGAE